jgi:hypothetical protein
MGIVAFFIKMVHLIILAYSKRKKKTQNWWRPGYCAMFEIIFIPLTMVLVYCLVNQRVGSSSWSIDIRKKRVGFPGNRLWRHLLSEHAVNHAVYKQLPGPFEDAVARFAVGIVRLQNNSRFLYQNFGTGGWHIIPDEDAVHYTAMELDLEYRSKALQHFKLFVR